MILVEDILELLGNDLENRDTFQRFLNFISQDKWGIEDYKAWLEECSLKFSEKPYPKAFNIIILGLGKKFGFEIEENTWKSGEQNIFIHIDIEIIKFQINENYKIATYKDIIDLIELKEILKSKIGEESANLRIKNILFLETKNLNEILELIFYFSKIEQQTPKVISEIQKIECDEQSLSKIGEEMFGGKKEVFGKRARKGERTAQQKFVFTILESLIELGGKGYAQDVIKRVEEKMKDMFTEIDYEMIPSGSSVRWENTAMWTRYSLVRKGYLSKNSPHGFWEITEEGRKHYDDLKKQKGEINDKA